MTQAPNTGLGILAVALVAASVAVPLIWSWDLFGVSVTWGLAWVIGGAVAIWLPGLIIATLSTVYSRIRGTPSDFVADLLAPTLGMLAILVFALPIPD
jgi:hypothetical protein